MSPPNDEQRRAWDGPGGAYWTEHAARYDRGVAAYQPAFLDAAAVQLGDRVLDIGCGAGQTSRDLARSASGGSVLGIDLSSSMLSLARQTAAAEGLHNIEFQQADAQTDSLPADSFDLAVSRHGTMFFADPVAAFTAIAAALRPGGRLVLLVWRPLADQEWLPAFFHALRATPPGPHGPGPLSLGDPTTVQRLLTTAGFDRVELAGLERPMWFGTTAADATEFIAGQFAGLIEALEPAVRPQALDDLHVAMAAHETPDGVLFDSACWLVTAVRPGR